MRTAKDVRGFCFGLCEASSRERDGIPRPRKPASGILDPIAAVDWHRLAADEPYPTDPGEVSWEIRKTNEAAIQRAYFFQGRTRIGSGRIRWLDAEVPVCPGASARRRSLDLFGVWMSDCMPDRRRPVVVELKYATGRYPGAGAPPFALFEALAYGASLYANRVANGGDLWGHRLPLDVTSFPDLIVAANRSYWTAWRDVAGGDASFLFDLCSALERLLATAFPARPPKVLNAHFPDVDFELQKGDSPLYRPTIPPRSNGWAPLASPRDLALL